MRDWKSKIFAIAMISLLATEAFAKVETILGLPLSQNTNLAALHPKTEQSEIIISRPQYIISYNKQRRAPNWVAWKVEANQLGQSGRSESFAVDSELEDYLKNNDPSYRAVSPSEYTDSCLDRGHQVPSADRSDSLENNKETFFMSNMTPQTPYLNRILWAHLEMHTRDLIREQKKKAYVIAGPIYDQDSKNIGPNRDIAVPSKFFKLILVLDAKQTWMNAQKSAETIAVIMPNTDRDGSKPNIGKSSGSCQQFESKAEDKNDWRKYQVSLQDIEKEAELKILPASR